MADFKNLKLPTHITDSLLKIGFKNPTIVQERVIPSILSGKSIIGQSQTGTGKTHSFLLPIMAEIEVDKPVVQAIVSAPTRELATQIFLAATKLNDLFPEENKIQIRSYIGGTDKQRSIDKLKQQPQLIIGTPGRIYDLIDSNALNVYTAKQLVVDEADLMIDLGFMEDVDKIASRMAKVLQILVFSATIPEKLQPFLKKYMENPKHIEVDPKQVSAKKIEHILVPSKHRNKAELIKNILTIHNPYLALIFANSKKNADELYAGLAERGLKVGLMHGDLPARERKRVMKEINELKYQYVVASDLAARGIDIEGVSHVINSEIPQDLDFYIHRSGRTGRASLSGVAITIYEDRDEDAIIKLEKMGITFTNKDVVKGEWVDLKDRNKRKKRVAPTVETKSGKAIAPTGEAKSGKAVAKPKAVKPGYKKKHAFEMAKVNEKERRAHKKQEVRTAKKATKAKYSK
ncbi:MAG: box helicase [Bacillales bacterium]|jgi:ATP-dependent RNA helicase CshB|nr:box helicase [Bacillales bacterium]